MTKFDIMRKLERPVCQTRISGFYSDKMVNIFKWMQLYIFHKLDHADVFFRLCTCFSGNLVELHLRNKEVLQTTRIWTQIEVLKPPWWSPRRYDQNWYMEHMIWSSDEEIMAFWKCFSQQNRRFQLGKPESPVFMDHTRIWLKIFTVFG
jgi:hypothetical protein